MKINCLPVYVYRNSLGDCTNRGISSRFDTLLLACADGHVSFDSDTETPLNFCAIFSRRRPTFDRPEHLYIAPAMVDENGRITQRPGWWMNGGNIASTSDSRFSELTGHGYPLNIHDRQER